MADQTHLPTGPLAPTEMSQVIIALYKGPVYQLDNDLLWASVLRNQNEVMHHLGVLGLVLVIDENDGFAFIRSRPDDTETEPFPRLVRRRTLSHRVSLMLALLRKRLAELDNDGTETRLVLHQDDIVQMLVTFLPAGSNEVKLKRAIDLDIKKVQEMGFLRPMRNEPHRLEVMRILRAFVDAQFLSDYSDGLDEYLAQIRGDDDHTVAASEQP